MALPSPAVLRGALRWLDLLHRGSLDSAWAILRDGLDSGLTATQYQLAYDWMLSIGAVDRAGHILAGAQGGSLGPSHLLLLKALLHEQPSWLHEADDLVPSPDDLPLDWADAGQALGLDVLDCFTLVRALGAKIDYDARAALGARGEELVVAFLDKQPDVTVEHVSLISDAYGFDVIARHRDIEVHLEVKTARPRGHVRLYLSRNEFETMRRDSRWVLVLALVSENDELVGLREAYSAAISASAPSDRPGDGRWETMRLRVRPDTLPVGLPAIGVPNPGTKYTPSAATSTARDGGSE